MFTKRGFIIWRVFRTACLSRLNEMKDQIHRRFFLASCTAPIIYNSIQACRKRVCGWSGVSTGRLRRPICLEPLLSRNVVRREKVVVLHVIWSRLKNLQVMEPAEESPECNVEFAVCESVNMSVRRLREEKGGKGLRRVTHGMPTHIVLPRPNGTM